MLASQKQITIIFLGSWTVVLALLFAHTAGLINISLLSFPQARGNLIFLEEYKKTNLLGLGSRVVAIPHGVGFIHPKRRNKMLERGIFIGASLQEVKSMVEAGTQELDELLYGLDIDYRGVRFLRRGEDIYGLPAIDPASGNPIHIDGWGSYDEKLIGSSIEEARKYVDGRNWINH